MSQEISGNIERLDDGIRKARKFTERFDDWFTPGEDSFIERYISGKLTIGLRCSAFEAPQYGFVIYSDPAASDRFKRRPDSLSDQVDSAESRFDMKQPPMLTHDIQLMEGPQKSIPALIRFERFDDLSLRFGEPIYSFDTVFGINKVKHRPVDRKMGLGVIRHAIACGYSGGKDIQAGSDDVYVDPSFHIEAQRKRLFFDRYYEIVRGWKFRIFNFHIDVDAGPFCNPFFEGWQLGYGPINGSFGV
jgi:hypothetical protein